MSCRKEIVSTDLDYIIRSAGNIANQINLNRVAMCNESDNGMYNIILKCLLEHREGVRNGDQLKILIDRWKNDTLPLLTEVESKLLNIRNIG